jgi:hypothetical protein
MGFVRKLLPRLDSVGAKDRAIVYIGLVLLAMLIAMVALANPVLPPIAANAPDSVNGDFYVVEENVETGSYRLLSLDRASLEVKKSRTTGDRPNVGVSADRRILYLFDTDWSTNHHTLSAIDSDTLVTVWQLDIPVLRSSFVNRPNDGVWLSNDSRYIYLLATADDVQPHITVVDSQKRQIVRQFQIQLLTPATLQNPLYWKLPWSEQLLVLSGNVVIYVDLSSGQQTVLAFLSGYEDHGQVPKNLPQRYVGTYGGVIDPLERKLILATTAQEVISVDLSREPITVGPVLALPPGWQFSGIETLHLEPDIRQIYMQIRRPNSTKDLSQPDEVWIYNSRDWTQLRTLDISEQERSGPAIGGLNAITIYPVSSHKLLIIAKNQYGDLVSSFSGVAGQSPLSLFYLVR